MLLFAIYANLASAMRVMHLVRSTALGLWYVHAPFVLIGAVLLVLRLLPAAGADGCSRMIQLDRYIARTRARRHGLVMAVLVVLGALFTFIGEQGTIGSATTP